MVVFTIAIAMVGAATISNDITAADARKKPVPTGKWSSDEVGTGNGMGFKSKGDLKTGWRTQKPNGPHAIKIQIAKD